MTTWRDEMRRERRHTFEGDFVVHHRCIFRLALVTTAAFSVCVCGLWVLCIGHRRVRVAVTVVVL
jgi:hypothetical protein